MSSPRLTAPKDPTTLIAAVVGVLLVLGSAAFWTATAFEARLQAVRHGLDVQRGLGAVLSTLQDAESGQRGYLLTGEAIYLAPYDRAVQRAPLELDHLSALVADTPRQRAEVDALRPLVAAKFEELNQTIILRRTGREAEAQAVVRGDLGRQTMETLRVRIARMDDAEAALLETRSREGRIQSYGVFGLLIVLVLAVLAASIFSLMRAKPPPPASGGR